MTTNTLIKLIQIIFIAIATFFTSPCLASDFRDAEWGMSKEQVKPLEKTLPLYTKDESIIYRGKVANRPVEIIFIFKDNKLTRGIYKFTTNNVNNNIYINDYDRISESLELKYGKPEKRNVIWVNELYKEKKGYHGNAISMGHLILESYWSVDKTIILHKLSGNNGIIDHSISYFDKNFADQYLEKDERNETDGL
jgi:hypothetical protein